MRFRIEITRRPTISDPEGATAARALRDLGYTGVQGAHVGRVIDLDVDEGTPLESVEEMCERLLANPVIEDYRIVEVE
ncbi:phosphoribosylformylglycinamidine synthase subunit PurS [bacterium]|nr:phosphoribosylformylglycinamidine synthase subunit PurS [bacterium]